MVLDLVSLHGPVWSGFGLVTNGFAIFSLDDQAMHLVFEQSWLKTSWSQFGCSQIT